jgi:hypothetical protein
LENEADEVAGTEDDGICARPETREVFAIDNDDAGETEVDLGRITINVTQGKEDPELTDAERRAGAIVRVTRYIRKLLLSKGEL